MGVRIIIVSLSPPRINPALSGANMPKNSLLSLTFLISLLAYPCWAQEKTATPDQLVQKLSSSSYRQRSRAYQELLKLKKAAIPALEKGLTSEVLEVQERCRQLLKFARRTKEDLKLDAFVNGKGTISLKGWETFKKTVGSDRAARFLFAQIYREDKNLLASIADNPGKARQGLKNRCEAFYRNLSKQPPELGDVGGLLFLARNSPRMNYQVFSRFNRIFYRTEVTNLIKGNNKLLKLVEEILERQAGEEKTYSQRYSIAQRFVLFGSITEGLKNELKQKVTKALKDPNQFNRLSGYASQLRAMQMAETIEKEMKHHVPKIAEKVVKGRDFNRFYATLSVANNLQMLQVKNTILKPALLPMIQKNLKDGNFLNRGYQVRYASQQLNMEQEVNDLVRPVLEKRMVAAAQGNNESAISSLYSQARYFQLEDLANDLLIPSAEEIILKKIEKTAKDLNQFQQTIYLAKRWQLNEILEAKIKPLLIEKSESIVSSPNLNDINRLISISRYLGMPAKVDNNLRKATKIMVEKLVKSKGNLNATSYGQLSSLIQRFQLKEGIPLMIRAANANGVREYIRGNSIRIVGLLGDSGDIPKLAPFLKNKTSAGTTRINFNQINTQLRDVALAAMIHLSGQEIRKYGFDYAEATGRGFTNISHSCLGFRNEARRQNALKMWQDWKKKQEKTSS